MAETATPMHGDEPGAPPKPQVRCGACPKLFTPRKGWQRFCSAKCRNAFHDAEKRKETMREAAPELFDALLAARKVLAGKDLEHVWVNYPTEPAVELGAYIDQALAKAGYKPEKPKA